MFRTTRYLAAVLILTVAVSACTSAAATTAPIPNLASASPIAAGSAISSESAAPTASPSATSGAMDTGALGGPVSAGGNFCALLGPGDFAAVGVSGAHTPTKNSDGPADAYCVYSGVSGATGGIEFDIFTGDPVSSYQQIVANGSLVADRSGDLPGVDAFGTIVNGPGDMAAIGVQKGAMTFDIDVPTGPTARAQLIALAKLVLDRGSGLSR